MEEKEVNRTRMNFSQNAKGLVQMDVTVEYSTPQETAEKADEAIKEYKDICTKHNLKLVEYKDKE